jgi:hypothetical protein
MRGALECALDPAMHSGSNPLEANAFRESAPGYVAG